jgi:hypothetical protein
VSILNYNGYDIEQRPDGYVNGTAMCLANDKKITDWLRSSFIDEYISALALETGIPARSLYVKVSEGFPAKTAYWLHPLLALNLGRWISPMFAIWCDKHIKTLLETGSTQLEQAAPRAALPSKALIASREIKEIHENVELISPRLAQFLTDCCMNEVLDMNALAAESEPKYRGVVEVAQEMGKKVTDKNRAVLGKFIKSALGEQAKVEQRLCNGTMRNICLYPDTEELRTQINNYFER